MYILFVHACSYTIIMITVHVVYTSTFEWLMSEQIIDAFIGKSAATSVRIRLQCMEHDKLLEFNSLKLYITKMDPVHTIIMLLHFLHIIL